MNIDERIAALQVNIESLHSNMEDLYEKNVKEHEILRRDIRELYATAVKDGESIRALARIAEIHESRLTGLEGDSDAR